MGRGGDVEGSLPAGAGRMDVERFLHALLEVLKDRPFVQSVDLDTEAVIVRGRVLPRGGSIPAGLFQRARRNNSVRPDRREEVVLDCALIEDKQRIWGVDYDDLRGWHVHPVDHPTRHEEVEPMSPHEVVEAPAEVWERLS